MGDFADGYRYYMQNSGSVMASNQGSTYVDNVNNEINNLINDLNSFKGYETSDLILKGDIAEFWHSGTFNINAALNGDKSRTSVFRSHDFASADILSDFGEKFGLKYYKNGEASANAQAVNVFQRFKQYQAKGGKDPLEVFLSKRGFNDINDPIYSGQVRIVPTDQLKEAVDYLKRKIIEETAKRPDQVSRYQETLNLLEDRIRNNKGSESIPLSAEEARKLAQLAKEGDLNAEKLGLTVEELIKYEYILKQSLKAGMTSATISVVLRIAPEIIKVIEYLIKNGEIDCDQFKKIGFAAVQGGAEGFIRGSISAAITTSCKAGLLGQTMKSINPSVVGVVTVIVMNTMKNSFKVAIGRISRKELANELVREMFVSSCSLITGGITQVASGFPVLGFMIGSFIGSIIGSFSYNNGYRAVLSFCRDTGFTMFGLVEQNYSLPEEVLKEIGVEVFEYEKFEYSQFRYDEFKLDEFKLDEFEYDRFNITFLRRGVIGVSKVGYVL